jgi:hypothetical protein
MWPPLDDAALTGLHLQGHDIYRRFGFSKEQLAMVHRLKGELLTQKEVQGALWMIVKKTKSNEKERRTEVSITL